MKKKSKKIVLLIIIFLMWSITNYTYATLDNLNKYNNYIPDPTEAQPILDRAGVILTAVRDIGIMMSVIALALMGIKYMLGSVEEKAEYKNSMFPYLIGCFFVIVGTTVVTIIYDIFV